MSAMAGGGDRHRGGRSIKIVEIWAWMIVQVGDVSIVAGKLKCMKAKCI